MRRRAAVWRQQMHGLARYGCGGVLRCGGSRCMAWLGTGVGADAETMCESSSQRPIVTAPLRTRATVCVCVQLPGLFGLSGLTAVAHNSRGLGVGRYGRVGSACCAQSVNEGAQHAAPSAAQD